MLWDHSEPKNYKIRILHPQEQEAQKVIRPESEQLWKDLDNTKVEFRSDFRPRARYLYFHYCIQLLRRTWKSEKKAAEKLKQDFGKGYWGTIGPYLQDNMLRAFVEELGHEYDELLRGNANEDQNTADEPDNMLLAVASSQIKTSKDVEDEDTDEEDEDSDEDMD